MSKAFICLNSSFMLQGDALGFVFFLLMCSFFVVLVVALFCFWLVALFSCSFQRLFAFISQPLLLSTFFFFFLLPLALFCFHMSRSLHSASCTLLAGGAGGAATPNPTSLNNPVRLPEASFIQFSNS